MPAKSLTIMPEECHIYHRRLPHWRQAGVIYFITWRLHEAQNLLDAKERSAIVKAIRHFEKERYELFAFVVMDDHVHVLIQPLSQHRLQDIVGSWKSYTANRLQREYGRTGKIWQDESFDRIVRNEKEFLEKAYYILGNPAKRWPDAEGYAWVWSHESDA